MYNFDIATSLGEGKSLNSNLLESAQKLNLWQNSHVKEFIYIYIYIYDPQYFFSNYIFGTNHAENILNQPTYSLASQIRKLLKSTMTLIAGGKM